MPATKFRSKRNATFCVLPLRGGWRTSTGKLKTQGVFTLVIFHWRNARQLYTSFVDTQRAACGAGSFFDVDAVYLDVCVFERALGLAQIFALISSFFLRANILATQHHTHTQSTLLWRCCHVNVNCKEKWLRRKRNKRQVGIMMAASTCAPKKAHMYKYSEMFAL